VNLKCWDGAGPTTLPLKEKQEFTKCYTGSRTDGFLYTASVALGFSMQGKRYTAINGFENRVLSRTFGPNNGKVEKMVQ